jgi:hypothetical protein
MLIEHHTQCVFLGYILSRHKDSVFSASCLYTNGASCQPSTHWVMVLKRFMGWKTHHWITSSLAAWPQLAKLSTFLRCEEFLTEWTITNLGRQWLMSECCSCWMRRPQPAIRRSLRRKVWWRHNHHVWRKFRVKWRITWLLASEVSERRLDWRNRKLFETR